MKKTINIFWFRRDLRLIDNAGLFHALSQYEPVLPIFIFDADILDGLEENDARVSFIHKTLKEMDRFLKDECSSSGLAFFHGKPKEIFTEIIERYTVGKVFTNHDYEPYAIKRDQSIEKLLSEHNIEFRTFKDHVIFEKDEVTKSDNSPYLVYTPYMKAWKSKFKEIDTRPFRTEELYNQFLRHEKLPYLSLTDIGFKESEQTITDYTVAPDVIQNYEALRNFPAKEATSRLGPHLRFGTVSIREIVNRAAQESNAVFLQELIWREFFIQILWHFPHTVTQCFKPKYDRIKWRNDSSEFERWCNGQTGYPLVDAGMKELNNTGFMHNRVRMVVASFLCKHLLIDWRWGEAYFAKKLHDYEMASNVGNWQWVAGCGVDAAPYFRIFNPTSQIERFDKQLEYINTWVPDLNELTYPDPMVDHKFARERCLKTYQAELN